MKKAITPETGAIIVEPIQGEGGVRVPERGFLRELRELCDEHGLLLIFDEVQTGVGRVGKLFAYEWAGVEPDIMAIAKGIGGGFPVGACLATEAAAKGMTAGSHGSTFGGNPLAMAVGNAVLDVVLEKGFLERVNKTGLLFKQRLAEIRDRHPALIAEVRGEGLLLGIRVLVPNARFRRRLPRGESAGGRGRRQRRAAGAAADRRRRRSRRSHEAAVGRLHEARGRARRASAPGSGRMTETPNGIRHFLDLSEMQSRDLRRMVDLSRTLKQARRAGLTTRGPLAGRTLAMIFDKPSTRTRVSFDVAMRELGGHVIMLTGQEMQLGRGETIADTARVLSRYVDAIMIRTLEHETLMELAEYATVPVINGLTRALAPVPGHGRRDDLRREEGPDPRPHGRLVGRRQQRAGLLGARGRALRFRAARGDAEGAGAAPAAGRLGQALGRR